MRKLFSSLAVGVFVAAATIVTVKAGPPSGAIFTTLPDGSAVNFNIYSAKEDVYLDGGPGDKAPQTAAGLDDGIYVFQVTDPSGKTLLSTDPVECRQFTVSGGIIVSTESSDCPHLTGVDADHGAEGAITVQLVPFNDTPNNGGEYKVWVTPLAFYVCAGDLSIVDCGRKQGGTAHGFIPKYSKTDNFKVRGGPREIDTRFLDQAGNFIDGLMITWTDTVGASNNKWSYLDSAHFVYHEAHVEDVEDGTHFITINNQAGCTVGDVYAAGVYKGTGPQTVAVSVDATSANWPYNTFWIDVRCQ
jgi:hypothetical protein